MKFPHDFNSLILSDCAHIVFSVVKLMSVLSATSYVLGTEAAVDCDSALVPHIATHFSLRS